MNKQVVFLQDKKDSSLPCRYFADEFHAFAKIGIPVGLEPNEDADVLFYRGCMMWKKEEYPQDKRYIQGWNEYMSTSCMSIFYPLIEDICIPTFFVDQLDENVIGLTKERGWDNIFIKNDIKSLWAIDEYASSWPAHTLKDIREKFDNFPWKGKYAIRKFLDPKLFYQEDRYWVLNGKIYYRNNQIPDIVKEAAERLQVLGSKYFVIDSLPNLIVEVNPGESSDRYGDNSPELFAEWWKDAFF